MLQTVRCTQQQGCMTGFAASIGGDFNLLRIYNNLSERHDREAFGHRRRQRNAGFRHRRRKTKIKND